ncbi:MAG: hypothetical protein IKH27_11605 [Oscillospiraceae bacterium]|nr:hypothetical protein [Oscillospiraceae bacterium]
MKKAVGANNDDEMSAVFAKCRQIGEKYYVSPDCVLNFDSLLAYPCSAILHKVSASRMLLKNGSRSHLLPSPSSA